MKVLVGSHSCWRLLGRTDFFAFSSPALSLKARGFNFLRSPSWDPETPITDGVKVRGVLVLLALK